MGKVENAKKNSLNNPVTMALTPQNSYTTKSIAPVNIFLGIRVWHGSCYLL